jgi:hypothetical protein
MSTAATTTTTIAASHATTLAGVTEFLDPGALEEVTGSSLGFTRFVGVATLMPAAYYHGPAGKK